MFLVYTFIKNPKSTAFIFYLGENFEILTMSHIFFVVFLADFIYFWQLCNISTVTEKTILPKRGGLYFIHCMSSNSILMILNISNKSTYA